MCKVSERPERHRQSVLARTRQTQLIRDFLVFLYGQHTPGRWSPYYKSTGATVEFMFASSGAASTGREGTRDGGAEHRVE